MMTDDDAERISEKLNTLDSILLEFSKLVPLEFKRSIEFSFSNPNQKSKRNYRSYINWALTLTIKETAEIIKHRWIISAPAPRNHTKVYDPTTGSTSLKELPDGVQNFILLTEDWLYPLVQSVILEAKTLRYKELLESFTERHKTEILLEGL